MFRRLGVACSCPPPTQSRFISGRVLKQNTLFPVYDKFREKKHRASVPNVEATTNVARRSIISQMPVELVSHSATEPIPMSLGKREALVNQIANIKEVWSYLKSSERPPIQGSSSSPLQTITLREGLWWPLGDNMCDTLFVRPSQQDIPDRIMTVYKNVLRTPTKAGSGTAGFIVKGTPGIGKTALLNLLVYYAAEMNVDVVIHDAATKSIFVLHSKGTVQRFPTESIGEIGLLDSRKTLYLFNPDNKATQARITPAFTVIATNPNEKHYSNFRKLQNMRVRFLYPWTFDEARAALQALQPTQELSAEQVAALKTRHEEVGGSIQYLLLDEDKYVAEVKSNFTFTRSITLEELLTWVDIVTERITESELKLPHLVFHYFPADDGISLYKLNFSSPFSKQKVVNAIHLESYEEWEAFVDLMLSIDPSNSSMGQV